MSRQQTEGVITHSLDRRKLYTKGLKTNKPTRNKDFRTARYNTTYEQEVMIVSVKRPVADWKKASHTAPHKLCSCVDDCSEVSDVD